MSDQWTPPVGREVSCRVLDVLFAALPEKGLPPEALTEGVEHPLDHLLDKHERIDWASYQTLMTNAGRIWSDQELVALGQVANKTPSLRPLALISKFLFSVKDIYYRLTEPRTGNTGLVYACLHNSIREVGPNHLVLERTVEPGYPPVREHFLMVKGALAVIPALHGRANATVEMEEIEGGARYDIWLPAGDGFLARLRRIIAWPVTVWSAGQELREAHVALLEKYEELETQIAERKKVEAELRRSESRYRTLVEGSIQGIMVHRDTKPLFVNEAFARILGYDSPIEILAMDSVKPLIAPYERERLLDYHTARTQGKPAPAEYEVDAVRKDGSKITLQHLVTMTNWDDQPAVLIAIIDITGRKQAEAALIESRRRLQALFDHSLDAIVLANDEARYVDVNPAACALFGYSRTELLQLNAWDITPEATKERVQEVWADFITAGQQSGEYTILRKDGTTVLTEYRAAANIVPGLHLSVLRDVTERKKMEEEIRASRNQLRSILETVPDYVTTVERDGTITFANHAHPSLTMEDIIGTNYVDWVPAAYQEAFRAMLERAFESGERQELETVGEGINDPQKWYLHRVGPVTAGDEVVALTIVSTDMTERKRAEEARRQSEERLRLAIANAPIILFSQDLELRYTWASNPNLPSQADAFIGATDADFLPADEATRLTEIKQSVLTTGIGRREEVQTTIDGKPYFYDLTVEPLRDLSHTIIGITAVAFDITERKQAAEALARREREYRTLTENLPDIIARFDREIRHVYVNRAIETFTGLSAETFFGKTHAELQMPPHLVSFWTENIQAVFETGRSRTIGFTYDGVSGPVDIEVRIIPEFGPEGQVETVLGINRDVTEQNRMLAALRASEARYRGIVEDQTEFIVRWKLDGTRTFVNDAYCRYYQLSREEMMGMRCMSTIAEEDRERVQAKLARLTPDHPMEMDEHRIRKPDGSLAWHQWIDRAIFDEQGRLIELQSVGRDITKRKQAEMEREQLIAELEAKNAELERFTYTVSHDLKSPLVTIRGFLGLLEKDAAKGDSKRMKEDIEHIGTAAGRMKQLLDELLELSRIGRLVNPSEEVDLSELARQTVTLMAGQPVQIDISSELPVVFGDRHRLAEVFQNLIDNAIKYSRDQPEPQIEVGVRVDNGDDGPVIYVRDNGQGIDPRYREKVFELFERLDRQTEGSGIGLAIVRRIVELHGGQIWVESEGQGQGSTFCFTLPGGRAISN